MIYKRKIIKKLFDKDKLLFCEVNYANKFYGDYKKHSHDTFCVSILKQGKISVDFHNKQTQYLQKDEILIFNIKEVHVSKSIDTNTRDYFTFHFQVDFLPQTLKNSFFINNILKEKEIYDSLISIAYKIINDKINTSIEQDLKSILNNIPLNSTNNNNNYTILLNNIKEYITTNIDEQISLDDIAEYFKYSKEHIIRIFKQAYGLSPHAYINNEKVINAKNLLKNDNNINISHLALQSGFYDQTHFTKQFKNSFGITPSIYKNN